VKIYTFLNLAVFIFQVAAVLTIEAFKNFDSNFWNLVDTPVSVNKWIFVIQIILIIILEVFFVFLPLPCMRCFGARQHFQNILTLKVKWFFAVQCLFQTFAIMSFILSDRKLFNKYPINFAAFFFLKVYVHYFGYKRVKYMDDGRDYVSVKEFLSIHAMFSVLNSWMTYFVVFNFFQFIKIWVNINYFHKNLELIGVVAIIIMGFESTVYLAYYKDVIFSLVTLLNFIGIYLHNFDEPDDQSPRK
jgi:hypothetical protein